MLATMVARPPTGPGWSFEIKWDGVRTHLFVNDGRVVLRSRKGTDMTRWFPELSNLATQIKARQAILDGEIIFRDGSPESFNALLARVRSRRRRPDDEPLTFVVFDILVIDDISIVGVPLDERRATLRRVVTENSQLVLSRVFDDGAALYALAIEHGLEGIVGKMRMSHYVSGRSRDWVKIKVPGATSLHYWNGVKGL